MLPRARVEAAISYRAPDVVPLRIFAAPGGLHEHGERLAERIRACGHDFGDLSGVTPPPPPGPEAYDPDGRYHVLRTDDWGITWEHRIFGVWGMPIGRPLDDLAALETYAPPPLPPDHGPDIDAARAAAEAHCRSWYLLGGGVSIFEPLHCLRRFEDALMDIASDRPEIHRVADMLTEHALAAVNRALACGADGIAFGDDYGTQEAPLLSPRAWRRFFAPRYRVLFEPVLRARKHVFFHSCGCLGPVLEDLAELGVNVVWPQVTAYDTTDLARRCRAAGLCVEVHPDRGETMQRGTPRQVRRHVLELLETFDTARGGSWLYLEVDPGFPWPNVEALFDVAREVRAG